MDVEIKNTALALQNANKLLDDAVKELETFMVLSIEEERLGIYRDNNTRKLEIQEKIRIRKMNVKALNELLSGLLILV